MSMHLVGPYLNTTATKKKQPKITKAKQQELEQGWRDRNARLKSMGLPKETFEQYMEWAFGKGKKVKSQGSGHEALHKLSHGPEKVHKVSTLPAKPELWVKGAVNVKKPPEYTGDKILGIATMHKSNAVPVFNDQAAKDISKMRRG